MICDQAKDQKIYDLQKKVKDMLINKQKEIEFKSKEDIDQRFKEELVLLKKWTESFVRQCTTENFRKLKTWALKEIKDTRELFYVPGYIAK